MRVKSLVDIVELCVARGVLFIRLNGFLSLDVWSTLKFIRDAGYDGYVSVEFEGMEDGKIGSETGMEAARYILANA